MASWRSPRRATAGLTVHAKASVLGARAWTAPTLGGTTLYVRDFKQIVALDLGEIKRFRVQGSVLEALG